MANKNNSQQYWEERRRKDKIKVIKTGEQGIDNLKKLLKKNLDDVERQIKEYFDKYADKKENLSPKELLRYKKRLQDAIKKVPNDKILRKILAEDAPKYKIDRLRALQTDLQLHLTEATIGQEKGIYRTLDDVAKVSQAVLSQSMKNAMGLSFSTIGSKKLKQILSSDWSGASWSERLWKDRELVGKKITDILERGMVQGTSLQKMSRELKQATNQSFNNAFRLIRTETSHIDGQVSLEGYKQAEKELGLQYYEYDAFLDSRTSEMCRELNGKRFKLSEAEVGVNYPPMHPNCRSTTQLVLDKDYKQEESGSENLNNSKEEVKKESKKEVSTEKSDVLKSLESSNIEKVEFNLFKKTPKTQEIIDKVGGGDMTDGSCSSLAFAFAGNRANAEILDFRGGNSCSFFSKKSNIVKISQLDGVESYIEKSYNDYTAVNNLLKNVVLNKEYYFASGRHAAIIKKIESGFEYLELQTQSNNGFKPLTKEVLKRRFSCQKTHTFHGKKIETTNILIDIATLIKNEEFKEILKYINTNEKNQKKGKKGFAK